MKRLYAFLLLNSIALYSFGQSDTTKQKDNDKSNERAVVMNSGVGYSGIAARIKDETNPFYTSGFMYISPAFNLNFDLFNTDNNSIGPAVTYQYIYDETGKDSKEEISRVNVGFRYLKHAGNDKNLDTYIGFRLGLSIWNDFNIGNTSGPLTMSNTVLPSFQVFLGQKYYFTKLIGIHYEVAIGAPYLAEGGITFRL